MAHFAEINQQGVTLRVVVIADAECLDPSGVESEEVGVRFCQQLFGADTTWKQTSYNGRIRKNFAGTGFVYDVGRDAFIPPRPYPSWVLHEQSCNWQAPAPMPTDGRPYYWDEAAEAWVAS